MGHQSPQKRSRIMKVDADEDGNTSTPATGTGLSVLPSRYHLRPQKCTISTTTTVIFNATKGQAFMLPFQYLDWWTTEPDTTLTGSRESGAKPSTNFKFASPHKHVLYTSAEQNFWYGFKPISGSVRLSDFLFFYDDLTGGDANKISTLGSDSSYIMAGVHGNAWESSIELELNNHDDVRNMLRHTHLPKFEYNETSLLDRQDNVILRSGGIYTADYVFNDPLKGFKMCWHPVQKPMVPTNIADTLKLNMVPTRLATGELTYNFTNIYPDKTFYTPGEPLHLLHFPDKADGQYIKMRCHMVMTTNFTYEANPAPPNNNAVMATSSHTNYGTLQYVNFVIGTKPTYNTRTNQINLQISNTVKN